MDVFDLTPAAVPAVALEGGAPPREDLEAVAAVLRSGWLTMGPRTFELEAACAQRAGVAHAVACAGPTAALHLVLLGLGITAEHAVVVPGVGGARAARAVRRCGAEVVVADVADAADLSMDVGGALECAGHRAGAVVAEPAGAAAAERCTARGVPLVECAPVPPSRPPRGVAAVRGVFPAGPGGAAAVAMILTDDPGVAGFARSRRSHAMTAGTWARHTGCSDSYDVEGVGFNYRVDELRSVLALGALARADAAAARREAVAQAYADGSPGRPASPCPPGPPAATASRSCSTTPPGARPCATACALAASRSVCPSRSTGRRGGRPRSPPPCCGCRCTPVSRSRTPIGSRPR